MKIITRNVQFRDENGRMVSSAIIANGSLHDEVIDYLDNNPEPVAEATASWLTENITQPTDPVVDASLSVSGAAADAKKTGDEISDLKSRTTTIEEEIEGGGSGVGWTSEQINLLDEIFNHVMFTDALGDASVNKLIKSLEASTGEYIETQGNAMTIYSVRQKPTITNGEMKIV